MVPAHRHRRDGQQGTKKVGAIDAATGETRWQGEHDVVGQVLALANGQLIVGEGGGLEAFDIETGEQVARWKNDTNPNCNRLRGSGNYWMFSAVTYLDRDLSSWRRQWITRSVCAAGGFPANGMMYFVPNGCSCFTMVRGYIALNSRPVPEPLPLEERLMNSGEPGRVGPASFKVTDADWPTYGGTAARTGVAPGARLPREPRLLWETPSLHGKLADAVKASPIVRDWRWLADQRGPISEAVAAGGFVVVVEPQAGRVIALDAASGEWRWTFDAEGRIDSPPTLHDGRVYFGSRDGYVYALDAATGEVAWRFLAAPTTYQMVSDGQLESHWPVSGSVLIHDAALWAAAGRHPELGGGIHLYKLDPATGRTLWHGIEGAPAWTQSVEGDQAMNNSVRGNRNMRQLNSVTNGILLADGGLIHLAGLVIDPSTGDTARLDYGEPYAQGGKFHDESGDNSKDIQLWADLPGGKRNVTRFFPAYYGGGPESFGIQPPFDPITQVTNGIVLRDGDTTYAVKGERYKVRKQKEFKNILNSVTAWESTGYGPKWQAPMPDRFAPSALIKAGDTLALVGWRDRDNVGQLVLYDAASGEQRSSTTFDARPIDGGLIAAGSRLYITTTDGRVLAFGE